MEKEKNNTYLPIEDRLAIRIAFQLPGESSVEDILMKLKQTKFENFAFLDIRNWKQFGGKNWFFGDIKENSINYISCCNEIINFFNNTFCYVSISRIQKYAWEKNMDVFDRGIERMKRKIKTRGTEYECCNEPMLCGLEVGNHVDFSKVKSDLESLGYFNISKHTEGENNYRVDFDGYELNYDLLENFDWYYKCCIKYPHRIRIHRGKEWYIPEGKWIIIEHKKPIFDCSDDDHSLNPAFW